MRFALRVSASFRRSAKAKLSGVRAMGQVSRMAACSRQVMTCYKKSMALSWLSSVGSINLEALRT